MEKSISGGEGRARHGTPHRRTGSSGEAVAFPSQKVNGVGGCVGSRPYDVLPGRRLVPSPNM